jgi:hypothetical protein
MVERKWMVAVLVVGLLAAGAPVLAGEEEEQLPTGLTAEMMAAWEKASTPGPHHEHIARMAGTWDVAGTFWMQPGAPPNESTGIARSRMILDGRFLQTRYESEFMGQPMQGIGIDGYDNSLGKHVGIWIDTASTAIYRFEGECSEDGKVVTAFSESLDPMTGEMTKMKSKMTMVDADHFTFEAWNEGPDGEFFKSMVLRYTRKKS